MKIKAKIPFALLIIVLLSAAGVWWYYPSSSNRLANVSWRSGGDAMTGVFSIVDSSGQPVVGAKVQGWNNSGYSQGIADTNGVARIRFAEGDLGAIDVDGKRVLDASSPMVRMLFVTEGLHVRIRLK